MIYNFGKHAGKTVKEVFESEPGYHRWMLDNDFPLVTKNLLKKYTDKLIEEIRAKKEQPKRRKKDDQNMEEKLKQLKNKFS